MLLFSLFDELFSIFIFDLTYFDPSHRTDANFTKRFSKNSSGDWRSRKLKSVKFSIENMGKPKHKKHKRHGEGEEDGSAEDASGAGLKLILKVGSKGHEKHKKKKKKKDKKKERDKERKHHHHHHKDKKIGATEDTKVDVDQVSEPAENEPKKAMARLLEQMLHHLQKKDLHGFFVNPVNDQIAPGYSSIISQPMDFSTMRTKLPDYDSLGAFRSDFELICRNAMTYNTADTIYYKSADKLLRYGQKLFSVDKLKSLKAHLPFASAIPDECLGIDESSVGDQHNVSEDLDDDVGDVAKVIEDIREVVKRPPGRFEAVPDDMTSAEILEQAKMAAKGAANRLKIYKPKSKMGFFRQKPDGSTSLKFLTGNSGLISGSENERPVNLGLLIGKVKQGLGTIQGFTEDRRNKSKSIHPLYYGAYSTHGPSYDSTFANLTKEETELVYSTYCDPAGVQYAESVLNFSRNCDYAMYVVDHLLDILTGNEHRKTSKYIEEMKSLRREDELMDKAFKDIPEVNSDEDKIDFTSLKSLQDDGIDMSFLENLQTFVETNVKEEKTEDLELLGANAQLIDQLKNVQNERLSATPPVHFSEIAKPSDKEVELANNIQTNLVEMVSQVKPNNIVSEAAIRAVMGIKAPLPPTPANQPTTTVQEVAPMEVE